MPDGPTTGVLLLRAWVEDHPSTPLRVVLISTPDIAEPGTTVEIAASVEEALELVRTWMLSLLDPPVTRR